MFELHDVISYVEVWEQAEMWDHVGSVHIKHPVGETAVIIVKQVDRVAEVEKKLILKQI